MPYPILNIITDPLFFKFTLVVVVAYLSAILTFLYFDIYKKEKYALKKIQKRRPSADNLWFEFYWSMISIFIWTILAGLMVWLIRHDKMQIYFNISEYGVLYFIFTAALVIILHDTYFYWAHRLMHSNKFIYKLTHKIHHHSTNPTALSIFSFGPLEAILLGAFAFLIAFILPIHITILLVIFTVNTVANIIGHMGYHVLPQKIFGVPVEKYFFTELQHNLHHQYGFGNFGIYFSFWDRILHTELKNKK